MAHSTTLWNKPLASRGNVHQFTFRESEDLNFFNRSQPTTVYPPRSNSVDSVMGDAFQTQPKRPRLDAPYFNTSQNSSPVPSPFGTPQGRHMYARAFQLGSLQTQQKQELKPADNVFRIPGLEGSPRSHNMHTTSLQLGSIQTQQQQKREHKPADNLFRIPGLGGDPPTHTFTANTLPFSSSPQQFSKLMKVEPRRRVEDDRRRLQERDERERREAVEQAQWKREMETRRLRQIEIEKQKHRELEIQERKRRELEIQERKRRELEIQERKRRELEIQEQKRRELEIQERKRRELEIEERKRRELERQERKRRELEIKERKNREIEEQKHLEEIRRIREIGERFAREIEERSQRQEEAALPAHQQRRKRRGAVPQCGERHKEEETIHVHVSNTSPDFSVSDGTTTAATEGVAVEEEARRLREENQRLRKLLKERETAMMPSQQPVDKEETERKIREKIKEIQERERNISMERATQHHQGKNEKATRSSTRPSLSPTSTKTRPPAVAHGNSSKPLPDCTNPDAAQVPDVSTTQPTSESSSSFSFNLDAYSAEKSAASGQTHTQSTSLYGNTGTTPRKSSQPLMKMDTSSRVQKTTPASKPPSLMDIDTTPVKHLSAKKQERVSLPTKSPTAQQLLSPSGNESRGASSKRVVSRPSLSPVAPQLKETGCASNTASESISDSRKMTSSHATGAGKKQSIINVPAKRPVPVALGTSSKGIKPVATKSQEKSVEKQCTLCAIRVSDAKHWEAHMNSPRHQNLEAGNKITSKKGILWYPFFCTLCDSVCQSEASYAQHMNSEKHTEKLHLQLKPSTPKSSTAAKIPPSKERVVVAKKSTSTPETGSCVSTPSGELSKQSAAASSSSTTSLARKGRMIKLKRPWNKSGSQSSLAERDTNPHLNASNGERHFTRTTGTPDSVRSHSLRPVDSVRIVRIDDHDDTPGNMEDVTTEGAEYEEEEEEDELKIHPELNDFEEDSLGEVVMGGYNQPKKVCRPTATYQEVGGESSWMDSRLQPVGNSNVVTRKKQVYQNEPRLVSAIARQQRQQPVYQSERCYDYEYDRGFHPLYQPPTRGHSSRPYRVPPARNYPLPPSPPRKFLPPPEFSRPLAGSVNPLGLLGFRGRWLPGSLYH